MSDSTSFFLQQDRLPTAWYNIVADLPHPLPPTLNPVTGNPVSADDLAPLLPMALIEQEVSTERDIGIPSPIRDLYKIWRPTPLRRARNLERLLDTPARIFYKDECAAPTGSFKPNEAIAQAYYSKEAGAKRLSTQTGAGQWGTAIAFAGGLFGLEVDAFMVRDSYETKPYRKVLIQAYGGRCHSSPSSLTEVGRRALAADPATSGTLETAVSEAMEFAATKPDTHFAPGSVLNFTHLHHSVIGLEALEQMQMAGYWPDVLVACVGAGSNFSGFSTPFLGKSIRENLGLRVVAAEPEACPSLTRGRYAYDFIDSAGMAPIAKIYTLGSTLLAPRMHAGGLRFHGVSPLVSHLRALGLIEAVALSQISCFEAGVMFARCEGTLPGPEANHAVRAAIDEALKCKREGRARTILFNLSGHGNFDMAAYEDYFAGKIENQALDETALLIALGNLPSIAAH